jgi:hypothetical protein
VQVLVATPPGVTDPEEQADHQAGDDLELWMLFDATN